MDVTPGTVTQDSIGLKSSVEVMRFIHNLLNEQLALNGSVATLGIVTHEGRGVSACHGRLIN